MRRSWRSRRRSQAPEQARALRDVVRSNKQVTESADHLAGAAAEQAKATTNLSKIVLSMRNATQQSSAQLGEQSRSRGPDREPGGDRADFDAGDHLGRGGAGQGRRRDRARDGQRAQGGSSDGTRAPGTSARREVARAGGQAGLRARRRRHPRHQRTTERRHAARRHRRANAQGHEAVGSRSGRTGLHARRSGGGGGQATGQPPRHRAQRDRTDRGVTGDGHRRRGSPPSPRRSRRRRQSATKRRAPSSRRAYARPRSKPRARSSPTAGRRDAPVRPAADAGGRGRHSERCALSGRKARRPPSACSKALTTPSWVVRRSVVDGVGAV